MFSRSYQSFAALLATGVLAACGGRANLPTPVPSTGYIASERPAGDRNYRIVHNFGSGSDGNIGGASLIDVNGTLYGTTSAGGAYGLGTVFGIATTGEEAVLYSFGSGSDGIAPESSLIDVDGTLYGTTAAGGTHKAGTVFGVTIAGRETVLHDFDNVRDGSDGFQPYGDLVEVDGILYGTTSQGGAYRSGTVFSVTTAGNEKLLHSFGAALDGANPFGGLIAVSGALYGTASLGGANGYGTVFRVTPASVESTVHSFAGSDGSSPVGDLLYIRGTFYGTTEFGGINHGGTVFRLRRTGALSVMHDFKKTRRHPRGVPQGALIAVNGTLYGTTVDGGKYNGGTVFRIDKTGKHTVLHHFGKDSDGIKPYGSLIDVGGTLYGTTAYGGTFAGGTVFALTP